MKGLAEKKTSAPSAVRDRLLDAAEQVVGRDGVSNLTLEAVAREAGVSKGGLLYHFPSKSELVQAIVARLGVRCEAHHAEAMATDDDSPGAFTRAYLAARSEPVDPEELPLHIALLAAAGTDPQFLDPIRARIARWQKKLESDGIDPTTATVVRLAIDGLCLGTLLGLPVPQGKLRRQVIERLSEMASPRSNSKSRG
jgi:AcrR family transcriptional regulator